MIRSETACPCTATHRKNHSVEKSKKGTRSRHCNTQRLLSPKFGIKIGLKFPPSLPPFFFYFSFFLSSPLPISFIHLSFTIFLRFPIHFPFLFPLPVPPCSISISFPSLGPHTFNPVRGLGSAVSSPRGSEQSQAAKQFMVHFEPKNASADRKLSSIHP